METLNEALKILQNDNKIRDNSISIVSQLEIIKNECESGLDKRVGAGV